MRNPSVPPGAQRIRTYADYAAIVDAYFAGHFELLIIVGRPGLAKSHSFEARQSPLSHYIEGWVTPLQAYIRCHAHRNKNLILSDGETLWARPAGRILLRALCESKLTKTLRWLSSTPELPKSGTPQEFLTSSRVVILCNRFIFGDAAETEAILDRAHVVHFDPLPEEVHRYVASWFWDQEIFDFIGAQLHTIRAPSCRVYYRAWEQRRAGQDWRRYLQETQFLDDHALCVQELESDDRYPTVADKAAAFKKRTGASRATYFAVKAILKSDGQLHPPQALEPPLKVQGTEPVRPSVENEVSRAQEEDAAKSPESTLAVNTLGTDSDAPFKVSSKDANESCNLQKNAIPPDDDMDGWLGQLLEEAMRRGDPRQIAYIRQLIRARRDRGSDGQVP